MTARARILIAGAASVAALAAGALALSSSFEPETLMGSTSGAPRAIDQSVLAPIPDAPPRSAAPLYWGAHIGDHLTGEEAPWDMSALAEFERSVGKGLSLVGFSSPFADCTRAPCVFYPFPTTPMENLRRYGAIPFFSWGVEAVGLPPLEQPEFQLSDVSDGRYDAYIRRFATHAKGWGQPFFLRFNWEMNGDWFLWAEQRNDNQPGDYIESWRHVHDIFTAVGATNATWVWCPNVDPEGFQQDLSLLYPGDEYVDWTCLDGYNWGPGSPANPRPWRSFAELYDRSYRQIVEEIAPGKPMIIGEFASSDYGGDKASWIRDALIRIPAKYDQIRGLLWFNVNDRKSRWPLETSPAAVEAFRTGITSPVYLANQFGALSASPIKPVPAG
jgi:hypothetical protein